MGFSIVDLQDEMKFLNVNFWNWRPTLVLLEQFQILGHEQLELKGIDCVGDRVTIEQARAIARNLSIVLERIEPGWWVLLKGSVTYEPDDFVFHRENYEKNYGATREWLEQFMQFCEECQGFEVS